MTVLKDATFSPEARFLAEVFVELQDERHGADYDPGYRVTAAALQSLLGQVNASLDAMSLLPPAERTLLAARLIGRTRG